jgi:hypothetical protein
MEAVVPEGVRACRLFVEERAQPLRSAERRGLEDIQLRIRCEQVTHAFLITAIESLEQFRHLSARDVTDVGP